MQESLGDYRILEQIGGGATAADVFRARDTRTGRTVAIKILTSTVLDDASRRRALLDEARAATALSHPNLAALYELGEYDHHPYLVFEFVPGQSLSALIAGRPLHARQALAFAIEIADGLADAHASDLVHRAITPDTIVVTATGHAKTLNLGLGGYLTAVAAHARSTGGTVAATAYWAPEQIADAAVDHRVDVYALGLVLVEMLTGRGPSDAGAPAVSLPNEVAAVVRKMIAADPDHRFASAATLAAELRQAAAAIDSRQPEAGPPVAPNVTAAGVPRWMLVVIGLAVALGLTWLVLQTM